MVQNDQGSWVAHHDVLYALRKIERGTDLEVFEFASGANDFYDGIGNDRDSLLCNRWALTEDGDVRAFQRAIWETDINIGKVETSASLATNVCTLDASQDVAEHVLMNWRRVEFPSWMPHDHLQTNPGLIGLKQLPIEYFR